MNDSRRYRWMRFSALAVILLMAIGCSNPSAPVPQSAVSISVPDAKQIIIACFYDDKDLPPLTYALNQKQRGKIVGHLRKLNWKGTGTPLAEIGMIRPDIDVLLTDESGNIHTYQLYWTYNSLADQGSGLLLNATNISKLRGEITIVTGLSSVPQPN